MWKNLRNFALKRVIFTVIFMKNFTFIRRNSRKKSVLSHISDKKFFEKIKSDTKAGDLSTIRMHVKLHGTTTGCTRVDKLPMVCPLARIAKSKDGALEVKECNGLAWLHVDGLKEWAEIEDIKKRVRGLPMTYAAFAGMDGRSVEILVAATTQDDVMPKGEHDITKFCIAAYKMACDAYSNMLPATIGMVEVNARSAMMMPLDHEPYYNPTASPMRLSSDYRFASAMMETSAAEEKNVRDKAERMGKRAKVIKDLIEFLEKRYDFRYDIILKRSEYLDTGDLTMKWKPVDDRVLNSMTTQAMMHGLDVRDKDVKRIVMSTIIDEYDAAKEYLSNKYVKWDQKTDHIGMLAQRVKCDVPQWVEWFRKWFLSMVAQWLEMNTEHGNSTVPLLISGQGYNKSTFCRMILPQELRKYYNDNLQPSNKVQMLSALHQYLLVNLDEFNQISPRLQEGFVKNMLQLVSVKGRRTYGKNEEEFRRTASFIATTNETSVLVDPTGSRRFIGIELTEPIDVSGQINYEQLYGQALWLLEQGEQYWFGPEEEAEIMEHNKQYAVVPPVVQLFLEHFEIVDTEAEGDWTSPTAIYEYLRPLAGAGMDLNSVKQLGRYLAPLFGPHNKKRGHNQILYLVRKKSLNS